MDGCTGHAPREGARRRPPRQHPQQRRPPRRLGREAALLARNDFGFRTLAAEELPKYFRAQLVRLAAELVPGIRPVQFREWGRPGIRAQLLDTRTRRLEMDFRFEGDERSFHVLNAVSPAFTCCLSFADFTLDRAVELMG
jgi:(S)-2-hydroxyglutarate dehydrogenase